MTIFVIVSTLYGWDLCSYSVSPLQESYETLCAIYI